jgi:DNA polymerase III delta subunit
MSSERKLRETLQAVLNDCRDIADTLNRALFPDKDTDKEQAKEDTHKLHIFAHTYSSKNNEEFKLKENSKNTLMPTSIRERLEELDMLE